MHERPDGVALARPPIETRPGLKDDIKVKPTPPNRTNQGRQFKVLSIMHNIAVMRKPAVK